MPTIDKPEVQEDLKILESMWSVKAKGSPMNYITYLAERVASWENYWNILKSRTLLMKYHKKWRAYAIAARLKYFLISDSEKFETEKTKALNGTESERSIENDNPRLADALRKFRLEQETSIPYIGNLLAALKISPEFAKSYIQTHLVDLIKWISSLKDNELKKKLRQLIIEISGAEIAEIDKCTADINSWIDFRIGNNVMFFHNRVATYLRGGKLENTTFLGLFSFFADEDLKRDILKSSAVRNLLTYQKQLQWFRKARKIVAYSIWNPGWEGFRGKGGFYYNLTQGEKNIDMVQRQFGSEIFAKELEEAILKAGEVPKLWLPYIDSILVKLEKDPTYINKKVIAPAAAGLIEILGKKKHQLETADITDRLRRLAILLRSLFNEAVRMSRNVKAYEELLAKELESLKKETRAEKAAFINALLDHGEPVILFVEKGASLVNNIDRIRKTLNRAYAYLTSQKLQVLRRRLRRQISPYSLEPERIRREDDLAQQIESFAVRQASAQVEEIEEMRARINENMGHASAVDEVMKKSAPNYITKNEKGI